MSFDYHRSTIPNVTDDRSLQRERLLPESGPANPEDANGDSNEESKSVDPISCLPDGLT